MSAGVRLADATFLTEETIERNDEAS
jgi:hypothetical protein